MGRALITDLYELTMAASYLRRGMVSPATFSLFVRNLPPNRGFLVAAGLEDCLSYLEDIAFDDEELDYLRGIGFEAASLEEFRNLRFRGDVWAVPEGRVVFANEPLLEVTAPLPQAQFVETYLLNTITHQTVLASKAARCRVAAADRMSLVDFSLRRTQGVDAGLAVARSSALVGFSATSNVEAARKFGLSAAGTMAHSYIEAFPSEAEAFRAFAQDFPDRTTFLVDTYDTLQGVRVAIDVIDELGLQANLGVRLDSGDLVALSRKTRQLLDEAGLPQVRVFASGGLDELAIKGLVEAGAPIDAVGVGTRMGVSADAPFLDTVYKLVAYNDRPMMKLSEDKVTLPCAKQVWRRNPTTSEPFRDVIGLRDQPGPHGYQPLLRQVMRGGQRLRLPEGLEKARARFDADLATLPEAALDLEHPKPPAVHLSEALAVQAAALAQDLRRTG